MVRRTFVLSAGLALILVGLETEAQKEQSVSHVRERLIGTWELVSTEERLADGSKRPYLDVGPNGKGYLIYTADGHMCAAGMNPDRPRWRDVEKPTEAEKLRAMEGFFGYCGRYEADPITHVIYHYPEVALDPNALGSKQRRPYKFDADELSFSDRDTAPGVVSYTISWKKVKTR
ncbi:MAG: hypothetical protein QOJ51_301 [Acidobacteriaceae bacterium]|jgi:hypothetical protein|nr:hypothetical protein [Acidobacteriaceae bacterium]